MLSFITTDCNISPDMLQKAMTNTTRLTYNMVVVDGDTSTNDMCAILASGLAGNSLIDGEGEAFDAFCAALFEVNRYLAREIAKDGEGATKLITCTIEGASDDETARQIAMSVIRSPLVKSAMFGADANWGRVLCAMGYSGADFEPEQAEVRFTSAKGDVKVCENGSGIEFDEEKAKAILMESEVFIRITLSAGGGSAEAYGCDLTYDYVKINGDYRT